jgi:hypothetical protein
MDTTKNKRTTENTADTEKFRMQTSLWRVRRTLVAQRHHAGYFQCPPFHARLITALFFSLTLVLFAAPVGFAAMPQEQKAVPVVLQKTADGWKLLRDGKPYFIKGAGGGQNLDALAAAGGNSCRTWGDEGAEKLLDEAQKRGLTVMVGIWIGHIQHGFKYDNPEMVKGQLEMVRRAVNRLKHHPAVLAWGIGNEMETGGSGENANLWKAVNDIAKMIKLEDPQHPAMSVVAEISREKIAAIQKYAPDLDILGINSYGGMPSLGNRIKEFGWTKPFVVTEFGPRGPWEMPKTAWGAPREDTSTQKAKLYAENYAKTIAGSPAQCLGSYCFLWDSKMEGTPTWFGMFLWGSGERLAAVESMTTLWGGKVANRAPAIDALFSDADGKEIAAGSLQTAQIRASDADKDTLRVVWQVRAESVNGAYPPDIPACVIKSDANSATFKAPAVSGAYRLYAFVFDDKGNAATANFPFKVQ